MSDIDKEFQKAVDEANRPPRTRDELEAHMHGPHGIVASTDAYVGVIKLEAINENELRSQHRRLHELGEEHRR
jgi:hypothetical protein